MSKSIFSSTIVTNKTPFTALSVFKSTPTNPLSNELAFIKILLNSIVVKKLKPVLIAYYAGNFQHVLELLPTTEIVYLTNLLYLYKKSSITYPIYEAVRYILSLYLQVLTQQNVTYSKLVETQAQLQVCRDGSSILDDMNKLRDYIETLSKTMNLFEPAPQSIVSAQVKPEHAIYLRTYGYPVGGIFDPEKLEDIISNMSTNTTPLSTPPSTPLSTPPSTPLSTPLSTPPTTPRDT